MVIGITGNSGSGKTTVSKILAKIASAEIINADEIVKEEQKVGKPYYNEILKEMGNDILTKTQEIDREKLTKLIFTNKQKREEINKITNVYIVPIIKEKARKIKEKHVILDVPLLFESGLNKICDITIGIIAENKIKIERLITRDKANINTITERLKNQAENEFYIKKSDYIIENNNIDIEKKVEEIWKKINLKIGSN